MSKTIEQKVVEMRFDNSNFERNVSQSMTTLGKLQDAIDKTSSGNAFAGLSKAVDNLNFGSVTTAIQTVTEKFSLWEEIAIGAARNIGAALSNYVVKGLNDMVFSNVTAGWDKYAQKTEAVQTIMASIQDQDFGDVSKMDYVSGVLEKLNWFTDETSFHFTDMVSSIGKFTSAGVDLEKASDAMMGIATWAAVSGANADTASRVMYQLSQSLGMGSVRTQDWMSVETANMATKEFKELAIQVAKAKGEITNAGKAKKGGKNSAVVTFQNFRETLKDGWLTSEVLNETLGQYSSAVEILNRTYYALGEDVPTSRILPKLEEAFDKAGKGGKKLEEVFTGLIEEEWGDKLEDELDLSILDENGKRIGSLADKVTALGIRAFRAGQEAKTFAEALGSVPDAASTVWMQIWEKVFGDYETAKVLWTDLANYLYDIFVQPLWEVWDVIDEWQSGDGRELLFGRGETGKVEDATGAFYIMFETIKNVESAFMEAFGEVFPFGGQNLVNISQKIQNFAKRTRVAKEDVEELTAKFKKFFDFFGDIIKSIDFFNSKSTFTLDILDLFRSTFDKVKDSGEKLFSRIGRVAEEAKNVITGFFDSFKFNIGSITHTERILENLPQVFDQITRALDPVINILRDSISFAGKVGKAFSWLISGSIGIVDNIVRIISNTNILEKAARGIETTIKSIKDGFKKGFDSSAFLDIKDTLSFVWDAIENIFDSFEFGHEAIKDIASGFGSAITLIGKAINFLLQPLKALVDKGVVADIVNFISGRVVDILLTIPAAIGRLVTKLKDFISEHPEIMDAAYKIGTVFASIIKFAINAAIAIDDFIYDAAPLTKVGGWIKSAFDSIKKAELFTKIGDKISEAFENIVSFFDNEFMFSNFDNLVGKAKESVSKFIDECKLLENVKTWFDGVTDSVKKFIDESEFLSKIKTNLKELWENIKKLFGGEENFEGFGANFMSGFAKGLVDNAKIVYDTVKKFAGEMLQKLKDFFGIHSPSTETEEIGTNLIDGLIKGLVEGIKKLVAAIKKVAGSTISTLSSSLFGDGDTPEWANQGEISTKNSVSAADNIKKSLGKFAKSLLGIGAIALPTAAVVAIPKTISSLMSPFTALKSAVEAFEWKMKGEVIANSILAIGDSLKKVLLAIGGLVLMIAGAAAIMAFAKKYTEGKNGEDNLIGPMIGLVSIVGEILTLVGTTAVTLGKLGGKSSMKMEGLSKEGIGNLERNMNETASWIKAIGDIFVQIGEAMLLFAGSVAIMAAASKYFGKEAVKDVMIYLGLFVALLSGVGIAVAKLTNDKTTTKGGLDWKKGITFQHSGWTEGLYAIGAFMLSVGTAMAAMALAAGIVIKASNGDVKMVEAAFQGMMGIMAIAMVALLGIVYIQEKTPTRGVKKSSSAIKDAAIALAAMSGSIRIIAKSVVMLAKEDPTKLQQGVKVIGEIGLVVFAFALLSAEAKPSQLSNAKNVGIMMLEMAGAFAIIGLVINRLGEMDSGKLNQGLKAFATFAMFFGVISAVSLLAANVSKDGGKFGLMGFMLMEIAASLVIVASAIKILDSIKDIGKSITGLLSSFLALAAMLSIVAVISSTDKVDSGEISAMSGSLLLMSGSFVIMAKAMQMMGATTDMSQAIGGLIATFVALGLLFALVAGMAVLNEGKGSEILKSAAGLALVAASMAVLMKIVADVGTTFAQNEGVMAKGVLALAAVLGVLAAVAVIANFAGPAMLAFGMGIAALGIGMLALAAGMFVFYQVLVLLSAEAAMFGGAVSDMIEGFLDRFIALGPKITDSISMIFKAIANGIADSAIEIVKAITKVIKVIGDNIDEILAILAPITDKLINWLVDRVDYLIALIQPTLDSLVAHGIWLLEEILLPAVLRCVQSVIDFISINIPALADMLVTTVESVVTRLLTLIDYLINSEAGILAIISRALIGENGILTILDTFLHLLLEDLRNLATDLVDTIVYIIQEVVNGIIDNIDIILTGIEDAINLIVDHIVSLTDTILAGIVEVIEGIATSIENHGSDIFKAIWHVVTAIIKSFTNFLFGDENDENSISHLAKNIMSGLGEGIKNFVGKVTGKISEVAGGIIEKFKSVFGIASPSKVMAGIGEYLDLGLAKGVDDNSGSVLNSVSGLGNGIIDTLTSTFLGGNISDLTGDLGSGITDALSGSLGDMSDLLNTDDFTPTITPVLDLSEIQNGASQIPGMINSGSGYTVDTNVVARSAYNPYEYYDGTEKVSTSEAQLSYFDALKAKMDEVVSKFANAKVVLDTGAVVGGIVDPMDMALGQRMAQVGRGVISSSR